MATNKFSFVHMAKGDPLTFVSKRGLRKAMEFGNEIHSKETFALGWEAPLLWTFVLSSHLLLLLLAPPITGPLRCVLLKTLWNLYPNLIDNKCSCINGDYEK
ncbi:hypothetical protein CR513_42590, partial [Mucuna pruriens]